MRGVKKKKKQKTQTWYEKAMDALREGKDYGLVAKCLKNSVKSKNEDRGYACCMLARGYKRGLWGLDEDPVKREKLIDIGVDECKNPLAMFYWIKMRPEDNSFDSEDSVDKAVIRLIDEYESEIFGGDDDYAKGRLCEYNGDLNYFDYYAKAADKNNAFAQFRRGWDMIREEGLVNSAIYPVTKAAEGGHDTAQCILSECYGVSTETNISKSWRWLKKSALQGNRTALYTIKQNPENIHTHVGYVSTMFQKKRGETPKNLHCFENTTNAVVCLLCIKKYHKFNCGALSVLPYDIVNIIARHLWDTRYEESWELQTDEWVKIQTLCKHKLK